MMEVTSRVNVIVVVVAVTAPFIRPPIIIDPILLNGMFS